MFASFDPTFGGVCRPNGEVKVYCCEAWRVPHEPAPTCIDPRAVLIRFCKNVYDIQQDHECPGLLTAKTEFSGAIWKPWGTVTLIDAFPDADPPADARHIWNNVLTVNSEIGHVRVLAAGLRVALATIFAFSLDKLLAHGALTPSERYFLTALLYVMHRGTPRIQN